MYGKKCCVVVQEAKTHPLHGLCWKHYPNSNMTETHYTLLYRLTNNDNMLEALAQFLIQFKELDFVFFVIQFEFGHLTVHVAPSVQKHDRTFKIRGKPCGAQGC